ncbi:Clp protease N-terminal domain-containing protein [Actinomadura chokoriensis]|uniref:Clp protease N-terminal domain-containing protein n=1 Tax=Actinomadura chokoriensis TaxID=454156 RepID=UPI0031F83CE3
MRPEPRTAPADASREVKELLVEAFRRAVRDGRSDVGTEHLLFVLLDGESPAKDLLAPRVRDSGSLMGMITAKGAEHWLGEDRSDESPGGDAAAALLREAAWTAIGDEAPPRPTGALTAALAQALARAGELGVSRANPSHLLMGLLHDRGNRACEALLERRMDRDDLIARLAVHPSARQDGTRQPAALDALRNMGMLTERGRYWGRVARALSGGGFGSPVVPTVRLEAERQAVRRGHSEVTPVHLLLGMLVLDDQLTEAGLRLRPEWARTNQAAELLRERGITLAALVDALPEPDTAVPFRPTMQEETRRLLTGARLRCHELKDPSTGTGHLLAVLVAEPGCGSLLTSLGVDTEELRQALGH